MKKRIFSLFLIIAMYVSMVPCAFAARDTSYEETLAQDLKMLGIFQGVSDTDFDLDRAPTRIEALIMLIRALGKDSEVRNGSWNHPFSDVPEWADNYVGYAYENSLSNGISATKFGTENANAQMYLTFMLRALGYSDTNGADFLWNNPYVLAESVGILPGSVDRNNFLRADVVLVSYSALSACLKNSTQTLAQRLISEGVFTYDCYMENYDADIIVNYKPETTEMTAEQIFEECSPAVFYIEVYDRNGELYGTGSGFFIDSDGTAVTNYHVIDEMYSAKAVLSNTQKEYKIEGVYDYDIENDWAVIKVSGSDFDYLTFGDSSTVVGGATAYAIGSPMGLQNTISQGLISNTNRILDGVTYIQTSAAISQGSSGGALINKYGKVIGITSAGFVNGENLGLAIPISVIDGYDKTVVTPLNKLFDVGYSPSQNKEYGNYKAEDVLCAFVELYANDNINEDIAYTESIDTEYGYLDASLILNDDNSLEVLIWEVYNGDMYFFSLDLTGSLKGFLYYNYTSYNGNSELTGIQRIDASSVTRDTYVSFEEIDGNINAYTEEEIATAYLIIGLDFVNGILENLSNFGNFTVRDLGFTSFK